MTTLVHILAAVALVAGLVLAGIAATTPGQYNLSAANAIQASQVYDMAAHYALLSICAFLAGILMEISVVANRRP